MGVTGKSREVIFPFCSALVKPCLESCVRFWALHLMNNVGKLERVQWRATKIIRDLGNKTYKKQLKELELFSLKKRLKGD